jgi:hypothetical protein
MDDWIAQMEEQIRKFPREAILISILGGRTLTDPRRPRSANALGTKVGESNCCYLCRLATVSGSP